MFYPVSHPMFIWAGMWPYCVDFISYEPVPGQMNTGDPYTCGFLGFQYFWGVDRRCRFHLWILEGEALTHRTPWTYPQFNEF